MLDTLNEVIIPYPEAGPRSYSNCQKRCEGIIDDIRYILETRLTGSKDDEYGRRQEQLLSSMDCFEYKTPGSINNLPEGILAEVFFLRACRSIGLGCEPSSRKEDKAGIDFRISFGTTSMFLNVSKNISPENVRLRTREGVYPTIFLPWEIEHPFSRDSTSTVAKEYVRDGTFDGPRFLNETFRNNLQLLEALKRQLNGERNIKVNMFGRDYSSFPLVGIQYINQYEELLRLISTAGQAFSTQHPSVS